MSDGEGVYEYGHLRKDLGVNLRTHLEEERGISVADYLERGAMVGATVVRRRIIVLEDWEIVQERDPAKGPRYQ